MAIRVRDLPVTSHPSEQKTAPDGSTYILLGRPTFLHCARCGGEFSATRGDYFMLDPESIMRCCGRALRLVTERRRQLIEVKP